MDSAGKSVTSGGTLGVPLPAKAQMRAAVICIGIKVGGDAVGRLLLRDTAWPGWITLAIDAALALLLSLGQSWARVLTMIRIVLDLTAWPQWAQGKDFFSLAVSAATDVSYTLALWAGQHRRLRYVSYGLSMIAASLLLFDAL